MRPRIQSDDDKPAEIVQSRLRKARGEKRPSSEESKKVRSRLRYRERYNSNPEFRAKEKIRFAKRASNPAFQERERERAKRKYHNNKERENARKREWARKATEHIRAYRKEYYSKNGDKLREQIYDGRRRRDPTYGLYRAIEDCRAGRLSVDELARQYGDALAQLDDRASLESTGTANKGL